MNESLLNRWLNTDALKRQALPEIVHQWLGGTGSMTRAMRHYTENRLSVQLLSSENQMISQEEASLLGLSEPTELLTREILMQQDGEPLLYGRSVFPASLADDALQSIRDLGTEPLGDVLFKANQQPRRSMQYAVLNDQMYLYQALSKHLPQTEPLYARRSLFCYHQELVLVQEVFLSAHPINAEISCEN